MPRFVILQHRLPPNRARSTHWDLLLEHGDVLKSWALPRLPSAGCTFFVDSLPDHRLRYLDYEGPLSGDRGDVIRWDRGELIWNEIQDDRVAAILMGERLRLQIRLTVDPTDQRWRFEAFSVDDANRRD